MVKSGYNNKIKSYRLGLLAEYISIIFLFFRGYYLVSHRYKSNYGEVDLIAKSFFSKTLVFVEVKARRKLNDWEVVSDGQWRRIGKSASFFIATNPKYSEYNIRFDLIIFYNLISLKYIKNSWFSDGL